MYFRLEVSVILRVGSLQVQTKDYDRNRAAFHRNRPPCCPGRSSRSKRSQPARAEALIGSWQRLPQSQPIIRLTSRLETIPSYPGRVRNAELQPTSGRHLRPKERANLLQILGYLNVSGIRSSSLQQQFPMHFPVDPSDSLMKCTDSEFDATARRGCGRPRDGDAESRFDVVAFGGNDDIIWGGLASRSKHV